MLITEYAKEHHKITHLYMYTFNWDSIHQAYKCVEGSLLNKILPFSSLIGLMNTDLINIILSLIYDLILFKVKSLLSNFSSPPPIFIYRVSFCFCVLVSSGWPKTGSPLLNLGTAFRLNRPLSLSLYLF